jgi:hypothetical protein
MYQNITFFNDIKTKPKISNCDRIFKRQTKTFSCLNKNLETEQNESFRTKFLSTDRKRFVSIRNFVSKAKIYDHFGNKISKMKAFNLEITWVGPC